MEEFKIVCFITKDSPYIEVANKYLLPSLKKLNIEPLIIEAENYHNWHKNVAQKPLIALQTLEKYKGTNIVLLDVDCTVESYPELFQCLPEEYSIALYTLDWDTWYKNNSGVKEVLSGTMFLRNTDKVKKLCRIWYENAMEVGDWEQKALGRVLKQKKDIKIYDLPLEYCYITSMPGGQEHKGKCDNAVIKHYQVSRALKRGVL